MFQILIVEDDGALSQTIKMYLEQNQFRAVCCENAEKAYDVLYRSKIDLILSDVMMPDTDGIAFAQSVRRLDSRIPILFLTARDDFQTKKRGYEAGIDDYMVKPVDLDELLLHIHALLRRAGIAAKQVLTVGNLTMWVEETRITIDGAEVPVTVREFNLLQKLLANPGKTFTRAQLMDEFWSVESNSTPRTVDVYMARLRSKLAGCDGFEIATVYGLGYKAVIR